MNPEMQLVQKVILPAGQISTISFTLVHGQDFLKAGNVHVYLSEGKIP